jgi:predicted transcriptional regulator
MKKSKQLTSIRITLEAERLLKELATKSGVSQSAVMEIAIRKYAKQEQVD